MDTAWPDEFRERMRRFEGRRARSTTGVAISIKLRVNSGCFHREHSPRAYEIIDAQLRTIGRTEIEVALQEHETGPEILAYVVLGVGLLKEVIGLVTAIIKARSEGIKKGDHPDDTLHLIVRHVEARGIKDVEVLAIERSDEVETAQVSEQLNTAVRKLLANGEKPHPGTKPARKKKAKKPGRRKRK